MVVTVIKTSYQKLQPEIISDRDYGYHSNKRFRETLISELSKVDMENNNNGFNRFIWRLQKGKLRQKTQLSFFPYYEKEKRLHWKS